PVAGQRDAYRPRRDLTVSMTENPRWSHELSEHGGSKCSSDNEDDLNVGCDHLGPRIRRVGMDFVLVRTWGRGSGTSSSLPSQWCSRCSLRAPSLKSRKYRAIILFGSEAVNSPFSSYFPNQVFPTKTGPYLPFVATWTS